MAHLYPTEPDITDTTPPQQVVFHFDTNSAEMTPTDLELIKEHARYLAANPAMSVLVNGHSDARGASQYNQQLSQRRAASVAELLIQYGALSEQIDTRAYGETIPVAEPENWYANRRVQLEYTDPVVITSSSK
jgi:peptidoglycan-associated lipoprotein